MPGGCFPWGSSWGTKTGGMGFRKKFPHGALMAGGDHLRFPGSRLGLAVPLWPGWGAGALGRWQGRQAGQRLSGSASAGAGPGGGGWAAAPGRERGRGGGGRLADRGPRAAAGGGHKKECGRIRLPLLHSPGPALGPAPWPGSCSPGPGRRGHGCEAAVPTGTGRLGLTSPAGPGRCR